jgi:hypothetical protein
MSDIVEIGAMVAFHRGDILEAPPGFEPGMEVLQTEKGRDS